jgi:L-alanine-DL-glutamate epimerase-like enolase superfamily enzyme
MQEYVPSLGPGDFRKVRRSYELAREHLGDDIDIIVHCHCELDTSSAIGVAQVVEAIAPLYYEDPLQPGFSEDWLALRRSTRLPILTGENLELAEQALPFLTSQAVDCLQPDIVNSGGITGTKAIADLAALSHPDYSPQCQRALAQHGEPTARRLDLRLPAHRMHEARHATQMGGYEPAQDRQGPNGNLHRARARGDAG